MHLLQEMSFLEGLKANNIDPDKYLALQNEFIIYCRKNLERDLDSGKLKDYLEKDQFLNLVEKFNSKLERERIQEKMREIT